MSELLEPLGYATDPKLTLSEPRMRFLLQRWEQAMKQRTGDSRPWIHLGLGIGVEGLRCYLHLTAGGIDKTFRAPTLAELVTQADQWLAHDERADVNATLGLTRDGLLPSRDSKEGIES